MLPSGGEGTAPQSWGTPQGWRFPIRHGATPSHPLKKMGLSLKKKPMAYLGGTPMTMETPRWMMVDEKLDASDRFLPNFARTRWIWRIWTGFTHQTYGIYCPKRLASMARPEILTRLIHYQLELHDSRSWGLCGCRWTQSWVAKPLVCSFPNSWGTGYGKNMGDPTWPEKWGISWGTSSGNLFSESHGQGFHVSINSP